MLRAFYVQRYERSYKDASSTAGDALTDWLLAVYRRRTVRHALVGLGYLDITRSPPFMPRKTPDFRERLRHLQINDDGDGSCNYIISSPQMILSM